MRYQLAQRRLQSGATVFAGMLLMLLIQVAQAHHGWNWASDEEFDTTGVVTGVALGNPHGEVTLDVDGDVWLVEVGQPWRNERAGLSEDLLKEGTKITVHGHRSSDPQELRVKAERVVIDGKEYVLYPDR